MKKNKSKSSRWPNIKRHHLNLVTTNIFAVVVAIFFMKSYVARDVNLAPTLIVFGIILIGLLLISHHLLKPTRRIERVLPEKMLLMTNLSISLSVGIAYITSIKIMGLIICILFASIIAEGEHIFYQTHKKPLER